MKSNKVVVLIFFGLVSSVLTIRVEGEALQLAQRLSLKNSEILVSKQTLSIDEVAKIGQLNFLNETVNIFEGVEDEQLNQGVGHDPFSMLPGDGGNCLLYGHREDYLWQLKNIELGDEIIFQAVDYSYYYKVTEILVTDPYDFHIFESGNRETLTVVTCYPFVYFGPVNERFVIKASLMKKSND